MDDTDNELKISTPINKTKTVLQNQGKIYKQPTVSLSNTDKILEHLNKKQKTTLDSIELIMMGHAQIIKTFSPKRQVHAKKQIANILNNLEIEQIDENEYNHKTKNSNSQHQSESSSYIQNNDDNIDVINLSSVEDTKQNYYWQL